eukprot:2694365-Lingulodinium_polyedra.AAC.1
MVGNWNGPAPPLGKTGTTNPLRSPWRNNPPASFSARQELPRGRRAARISASSSLEADDASRAAGSGRPQ